MARARAIATRCCCPPERLAGRESALCFNPTRSNWLNASSRAWSLDMPRSLRSARVMFSATVLCGNRLNCWNTMPMRRRSSSGLSFRTDFPSSRMSPWSGSMSRFMTRSKVDLPEPDGPMTDAVVPFSTCRSMPRRTWLLPKERWMFFAVSDPEENSLMPVLPSRRLQRRRPVLSFPAGLNAAGRRSSSRSASAES